MIDFGTHIIGPGRPFTVLKLLGRVAVQLPPSRAEVKNTWSYITTPLLVFIAFSLIKYSDNFTLKKQDMRIGIGFFWLSYLTQ